MPNCKQCSSSFEVTDKDREFYSNMDVPEPSLCPDCRQQKRLVWRNERSLYRRNCDLTSKSVVSFYHPGSPYTVYAQDEWWSDKWDALEYARDFDFNKPFFEQFDKLLKVVPHMSLLITHGENSDYCPYSVNYKNSYMCVSGVVGENIYYSFWTNDSEDCMDCYACFRARHCYECVQCINLYNSIFCKDSDNSSDLAFCVNCDSCKYCIGCYGLKHKEYFIFNEKVTPEEYEKLNKEMHSSYKALCDMRQKLMSHVLKYPQRALQMVNTENCTGDYLLNCKNSRECYLAEGLEDCAYCWNIPQRAANCQDINYSPKAELTYNSLSATHGYNCISTISSWDTKNSFYCFECFYCNDCFGCVGLKHKQFCILNKQYSKDEYVKLLHRIIEHMKQTKEWGEFFPVDLSPFAYNESIANDFFPMTEEKVLEQQWKWSTFKQELPKVEKVIPANRLPDAISEIPDDILNWAIECAKTKKLFKIIPQELKFYREHNLPIPHYHPDIRYKNRLQWVNPRKLWERKCAKCGIDIRTSYSPDRPEKVYCEKCYLETIY